MKRRIATAVNIFLILSCLSLVLGYNAHQLFSRQYLFSWSMLVCLKGLTIPTVRTWFVLLEGGSLLATVWMVFSREHIKYKSEMIHVCLNIYTPAADGQGQYGTAHWLPEKEKEKVFSAVRVDRRDPLIRELIVHGRDDLEDKT